MKVFVRVAFCLLIWQAARPALAQQAVPNGGLETWITRNGAEVPQTWLTTDDAVRAAGLPLPSTGAVTKSTDKHGGNFAAQLSTKSSLLDLLLGPLPGVLLLGTKLNTINPTNLTASVTGVGGVPYTSRPARFQFYYKLTGANAATDSAIALVVLTRTVNKTTQLVGDTALVIKPASAYTLVDLPIYYRRTDAPDSLRIVFVSGTAKKRTAGTTLFIDDVTLTGGAVTATAAKREAGLTVYPNPSAEGTFVLTSFLNPAVTGAPLTVTDAAGRIVLQQGALAAGRDRAIDLRGQPAGVYLLQLNTPTGMVTRKLLIDK